MYSKRFSATLFYLPLLLHLSSRGGFRVESPAKNILSTVFILYGLYMDERELNVLSEGDKPNAESEKFKPLFKLGQLVGTPGALNTLRDAEQDHLELLCRHVTGDWGNLDDEDKKSTDPHRLSS
jgi:hypothetical protein